MSGKRTIRIRYNARDENDPKALFEECKRAVEQKTGTRLPDLPAAPTAPAAPPERTGDQIAQEVWETVCRQSAAEQLEKKQEAIEAGTRPPVSADPKVLAEKKEALHRLLAKGGVKILAASVAKKLIDWVVDHVL